MEIINPLKSKYPIVVRLTVLIGIFCIILNFLVFPRFINTVKFDEAEQVIIENIEIPQTQQIIPLESDHLKTEENEGNNIYEFEPDEDEILSNLLPKNITTQIFKAMLENSASEQGSRMTAMDNATRNAGELVDKLTIEYNRSRQAAITKELIEIISGAESL